MPIWFIHCGASISFTAPSIRFAGAGPESLYLYIRMCVAIRKCRRQNLLSARLFTLYIADNWNWFDRKRQYKKVHLTMRHTIKLRATRSPRWNYIMPMNDGAINKWLAAAVPSYCSRFCCWQWKIQIAYLDISWMIVYTNICMYLAVMVLYMIEVRYICKYIIH